MEFKHGDKVVVSATDKQLAEIGMDNKKINRNLRKYESTISEILIKGGFKAADGTKVRSVVLDSTFTIPECYLILAEEAAKQKEETIVNTEFEKAEVEEDVLEEEEEEIIEEETKEDENTDQG